MVKLHDKSPQIGHIARHLRRPTGALILSPTVARPPTGAAAGYDSDGRGRDVVEGRRKVHGSANQIHATIWRTKLRAKAV